jgi:DNA replication protein DnaC
MRRTARARDNALTYRETLDVIRAADGLFLPPPRPDLGPCRECGGARNEDGACPPCQERYRREFEAHQWQMRMQARDDAILAMGLSRRWLECTLTWKPTAALDHVWTYRETGLPQGRALVLLGPTGVGKTAAVCALALSQLTDRWKPVRFYRTPDLVRQLLNGDFAARDALLATTMVCRLLILDDLDAAYLKPDGLAQHLLEEILMRREDETRATVLTSNLTVPELAEAFSDRVIDRFRAWATIVVVAGSSLRHPPHDEDHDPA